MSNELLAIPVSLLMERITHHRHLALQNPTCWQWTRVQFEAAFAAYLAREHRMDALAARLDAISFDAVQRSQQAYQAGEAPPLACETCEGVG